LVARPFGKVEQGHLIDHAELARVAEEGIDALPVDGGITACPQQLQPVGLVAEVPESAHVPQRDPEDPSPARVLRDERRAYENGSAHDRRLRSRAAPGSRDAELSG